MKKASLFRSCDIGIDLGTSSVLVYVKGRGIVINEPSVVAIDTESNQILQVGEQAKLMIGKTPKNIIAMHPLKDGVISNFDITLEMIKYFLRKVVGKRVLFKPRVIVCVPSGVTDVEKRAVIQATNEAGAKNTYIIEEPVAAAMGAGIDISGAFGHFIIDIGGGTCDVAVVSLGNPVISESIRVAGDKLDEAIVRHIKTIHGVLIGNSTAQHIKQSIGSAVKREQQRAISVTGRDIVSGLPKTITITSDETALAINEPLMKIIEKVMDILERTPPELSADIAKNGVCMTGGGALLFGFDQMVSAYTKLPCKVAKDPISCVALGSGSVLDQMDSISAYSPVKTYKNTIL